MSEHRDAVDAQTEAERLSGDYYDHMLDRQEAAPDARRLERIT